MSSLRGKVILLTCSSMGIGEEIASHLAERGASLILFSRSEDKLAKLQEGLDKKTDAKIIYRAVDVGDIESVEAGVTSSVKEMGSAVGAPKAFHELKISDILIMNNTNVNGYMFVAHSVLNNYMFARNEGTILNITSITALEVPPSPDEAVYHANKACQEAVTNALRNELSGSNIGVLALRPGCVATNFHSLRVGHDEEMYDSFFNGFQPLLAQDIAQASVYMLEQPFNISIKAMDVGPSAQRSINVFDRTWNERQKQT